MPRPWLRRATPLFGNLTDHEIARRLGAARSSVSMARRELGIAPAPHPTRPPAHTWLPRVRHLLGKLPDREVGKQAGVSFRLVAKARKRLGIAACGKRPRVRSRGVALTPALLRSNKSAPEIARMTGVAVQTIYGRRRAMGIATPKRPEPAWVKRALPMLGKVPDVEIARRLGCSGGAIGALRRLRGIARAPAVSRAPLPDADIRHARRTLTGPDRVVFEGRFVARPPRAFADIGRELGVSRQAVAEREARLRSRLASSRPRDPIESD